MKINSIRNKISKKKFTSFLQKEINLPTTCNSTKQEADYVGFPQLFIGKLKMLELHRMKFYLTPQLIWMNIELINTSDHHANCRQLQCRAEFIIQRVTYLLLEDLGYIFIILYADGWRNLTICMGLTDI